MKPNPLSPDLLASPRVAIADVSEAKAAGLRALLRDRPDGEATDRPPFAVIEAEAARLGPRSRYGPTFARGMTDTDVVDRLWRKARSHAAAPAR